MSKHWETKTNIPALPADNALNKLFTFWSSTLTWITAINHFDIGLLPLIHWYLHILLTLQTSHEDGEASADT